MPEIANLFAYKNRSLFITGRAIEGIYATLQKMVTFSHWQGDRVNLRKFTKDGYFFSPAGRSGLIIL